MNDSQYIALFIIVGLSIFIGYLIIKRRLKNRVETITCYTGGLGSGKTLLSVETAISLYNKQCFKWKIKNDIRKLLNKFRTRNKYLLDPKPCLYSNIPILINKKKNIYSYELTNDILLLQTSIPKNSVCLIDEIGAYASQYDYNEKNIRVNFSEFVRFFRHFTKGGYLVVNDQCSENINLEIRRRINTIHNLSNCLVIFNIVLYFDRLINISEEIKTIDIKQGEEKSYTQDNKDLKIKLLSYKKRYDTYCYSDRYLRVPKNDDKSFNQLKINDYLKCDYSKDSYKLPKTYLNIQKKGDSK